MSDEIEYTKVDEAYTDIFGEIWQVLTVTYTIDGAMIWLNSRNTGLGMDRPIDLINSGRGLEVRNAAYDLESDG